MFVNRTRYFVHSQSIIKHAIYMDNMSTPETLEGFSNALSRCSKHPVGAWAILYLLVQVRGSWELLIVVNKAPCSLLVNY